MSTSLDSLTITETSAVDDPANLLPGWMIQKAKGTADLSKALDGWLEEAITKADPTTISALATIAKANPGQPRNAAGQFRPAIPGIDPAGDVQPEEPSRAEKHTGFFKPARNVYRRIF